MSYKWLASRMGELCNEELDQTYPVGALQSILLLLLIFDIVTISIAHWYIVIFAGFE